jgi:hypothetical protein
MVQHQPGVVSLPAACSIETLGLDSAWWRLFGATGIDLIMNLSALRQAGAQPERTFIAGRFRRVDDRPPYRVLVRMFPPLVIQAA